MRDHTKLRAFQLADELVIMVYRYTQGFPQHEHFGLRSQLRRCAISVPSNIVEGSARHSEADYLRFLDIAYGSARELEYQLSLANRLGYLDSDTYQQMRHRSVETGKVLAGLIRSLRRQHFSSLRPIASSQRGRPPCLLQRRMNVRLGMNYFGCGQGPR